MDSIADVQAKSHYDIVVIGGGISGVSTVYHFLLNSQNKTTKSLAILEARSRLGGRIHAMDLPSKTVEFGAQWIHGIIGNPICDIALANRLVDPLLPEPASQASIQGKRYTVTGITEFGSKIPLDIIEETYQAYLMISKQAESYFTCDDGESGNKLPPASTFSNSLGKNLVSQIKSYLKSKQNQLPSNTPDLKIIKGIFENLLQREACISGSHSVYDVSLRDFGSYEELPGGNLIVEGGYISILNVLLDAIDNRIIELNSITGNTKLQSTPGHNNNDVKGVVFDCLLEHEVVNIKWKNVSGKCPASFSSNSSTSPLPSNTNDESSNIQNCNCYVELTCSNDTIITANHVVVTIPLGVLKSSHEKLFTPNLPEYKMKSISSLGFSVVDKIFLEFKNKLAPKFLDPSVNEYLLIWTTNSDDEDQMDCSPASTSTVTQVNSKKDIYGNSDDEFSIVIKQNSPNKWWRTIYSFTRISEYALLGWLSGKEAELVESLDSQDVGKTITEEILRRFFHPEFPEPESTFVTKWSEDPYSKGSYTFVCTESSVNDIELLSQPIYSDPCHEKPILLFAGEACHPNYYSTVHGAFLTGKKSASYLLDPETNSPR